MIAFVLVLRIILWFRIKPSNKYKTAAFPERMQSFLTELCIVFKINVLDISASYQVKTINNADKIYELKKECSCKHTLYIY